MFRFQYLFLGLCLVTLSVVSLSNCEDKKYHFVKRVKQDYEPKLNNRLIEQIHQYNTNSYFYRAYASYFQRADMDLHGFMKYFLDRSVKIAEQAKRMTKALNQRGGHLTFNNIELENLCSTLYNGTKTAETCYFVVNDKDRRMKKEKAAIKAKLNLMKKGKLIGNPTKEKEKTSTARPNALDAVRDALALERTTNKNLLELMYFCMKKHDPAMRRKLDDELEEQVDVIYKLGNLVTRLETKISDYVLAEYIIDSEITYE